MTLDERRRTAIHEAAHGVADVVFGTPVEYVSIRSGKTFGGISVVGENAMPEGFNMGLTVQQPAEVRTHVERRIIAYLAGNIAALWLAEAAPSSFRGDDDAIAVAALEALGPRLAELVVARERSDEASEGDEENAWQLAVAFVGPAERYAGALPGGVYYLEWLRAEARTFVIRYQAAILRVADALERHAVLQGEQVAALVYPNRSPSSASTQ